MLRSATTDLYVCAGRVCLLCSLILIWLDRQFVQHKSSRIHMGCCIDRAFLIPQHPSQLESGWRFAWWYSDTFDIVYWQHSADSAICCMVVRYECSRCEHILFLLVYAAGCRARHICRETYLLSLETVVRNSSSCVRKSESQTDLILCIREV
jgi:hypothetical protein